MNDSAGSKKRATDKTRRKNKKPKSPTEDDKSDDEEMKHEQVDAAKPEPKSEPHTEGADSIGQDPANQSSGHESKEPAIPPQTGGNDPSKISGDNAADGDNRDPRTGLSADHGAKPPPGNGGGGGDAGDPGSAGETTEEPDPSSGDPRPTLPKAFSGVKFSIRIFEKSDLQTNYFKTPSGYRFGCGDLKHPSDLKISTPATMRVEYVRKGHLPTYASVEEKSARVSSGDLSKMAQRDDLGLALFGDLTKYVGCGLIGASLMTSLNEQYIDPVYDAAEKFAAESNLYDPQWRDRKQDRMHVKRTDLMALGGVNVADPSNPPMALIGHFLEDDLTTILLCREKTFSFNGGVVVINHPLLFNQTDLIAEMRAFGCVCRPSTGTYDQRYPRDGPGTSVELRVASRLRHDYDGIAPILNDGQKPLRIARLAKFIALQLPEFADAMETAQLSVFSPSQSAAFPRAELRVSNTYLRGYFSRIDKTSAASLANISASVGVGFRRIYTLPSLDLRTEGGSGDDPTRLLDICHTFAFFAPVEIENAVPQVTKLLVSCGMVRSGIPQTAAVNAANDFPTLIALRAAVSAEFAPAQQTPGTKYRALYAAMWDVVAYVVDPTRWVQVIIQSAFPVVGHEKRVFIPRLAFEVLDAMNMFRPGSRTLNIDNFTNAYQPAAIVSRLGATEYAGLVNTAIGALAKTTSTSSTALSPAFYNITDGKDLFFIGYMRILTALRPTLEWTQGTIAGLTANFQNETLPTVGGTSLLYEGTSNSIDLISVAGQGYAQDEKAYGMLLDLNGVLQPLLVKGNSDGKTFAIDYIFVMIFLNQFAWGFANGIVQGTHFEDSSFAMAIGVLTHGFGLEFESGHVQFFYEVFHLLIDSYVRNLAIQVFDTRLQFQPRAGEVVRLADILSYTVNGANINDWLLSRVSEPTRWRELVASSGVIQKPPVNLYSGLGLDFTVKGETAAPDRDYRQETYYVYRASLSQAATGGQEAIETVVGAARAIAPDADLPTYALNFLSCEAGQTAPSLKFQTTVLPYSTPGSVESAMRTMLFVSRPVFQASARIYNAELGEEGYLTNLPVSVVEGTRFRDRAGRREKLSVTGSVITYASCYDADEKEVTGAITLPYRRVDHTDTPLNPKMSELVRVSEYATAGNPPDLVPIVNDMELNNERWYRTINRPEYVRGTNSTYFAKVRVARRTTNGGAVLNKRIIPACYPLWNVAMEKADISFSDTQVVRIK